MTVTVGLRESDQTTCTLQWKRVRNKPVLAPAIQFIKKTLFITLGVHHYALAQGCALPMQFNCTVLYTIVLPLFFLLTFYYVNLPVLGLSELYWAQNIYYLAFCVLNTFFLYLKTFLFYHLSPYN